MEWQIVTIHITVKQSITATWNQFGPSNVIFIFPPERVWTYLLIGDMSFIEPTPYQRLEQLRRLSEQPAIQFVVPHIRRVRGSRCRSSFQTSKSAVVMVVLGLVCRVSHVGVDVVGTDDDAVDVDHAVAVVDDGCDACRRCIHLAPFRCRYRSTSTTVRRSIRCPSRPQRSTINRIQQWHSDISTVGCRHTRRYRHITMDTAVYKGGKRITRRTDHCAIVTFTCSVFITRCL